MREYALELVRRNYRDFGPTLATEALVERHRIKVGRETVRKLMVADGLWLSRSNGAPSISRGSGARATASLSRSMGVSTAGSRTAASLVRCWCSSMTPRASS